MDDFETESLNAEQSTETQDNIEVSDADLDAAFQEFMGDTLEETKVTTETDNHTEPQISHPESSRLGRKVRYMEDNMVSKREFTELNSKLDRLFDTISRKPEEKEFDEYGQEIQKPVDIDKLVDERIALNRQEEQRKEFEVNKMYTDNYVKNLRELINEIDDPVIARQVFQKMTEEGGSCNKKLSNDPAADCSKNFIRAIKSVSTPFSGKRGSSVPTGISATSTNKEPTKTVPKLDPEAEEYVRAMGMSEEDILSALDGEIPARLKGTKQRL